MNTQDPHKHPLYRPHHGDMTGWRYLEKGEKLIKGDQGIYQNYPHDKWDDQAPCGIKAGMADGVAFRRRVTAESKPVEQKRFVTVVIDTNNQEHWKWVQYAQLPYDRIREGNALALLDGIEERVVKAIREGV